MEGYSLCFCLTLLVTSVEAFPLMPKGNPVPAIQGLVSRILGPKHVDDFLYVVIPDENGFDVFEVDVALQGGKPVLRGNNGVALASAFNYYLKYFCNCSISWGRDGTGDQLRLPTTLPLPREKIRIVFPNRYRYYQNVCTVSYSMAWWSWARWEREIDWMAMNGLNFILSFTGQEYVWQKFYTSLGLTDEEIKSFFSGPAFLAWQRMGNVRGWGGPLDDGWIKKQAKLQLKITVQLRMFGMINVLPGFAGHVPQGIQRVFPSANLTRNTNWGRLGANFSEDYLLEPTDPLFLQLGKTYYEMITEEYGNDHYFNTDTYNEMTPSSGDLTFLKETNAAIYKAMSSFDDEAVFVMQGWLFIFPFWQDQAKVEAFLSGVPNDSMIILDLACDLQPKWETTQSFYGKPFIWCLLHNLGGARGIYGNLTGIANQPVDARNAPGSSMVGIGMTPEAIEHNPVVYDLMGTMGWMPDKVTDVMKWIDGYITRRYGAWTQEAHDAWQLLLDGAYDVNWSHQIRSIATRAPEFTWFPEYALEPGKIAAAWKILMTAVNDKKLDISIGPLRYDIVDIGRQTLINIFADLYKMYTSTFLLYNETKDAKLIKGIDLLASAMIDLLSDLDTLLATDTNFLLGHWLTEARKSAPVNASKDMVNLIEFNARNQITMWGPNENILDYAGKEWAGLIRDYDLPRWKMFFDLISDSIQGNEVFNVREYQAKRLLFEEDWDYDLKSYPTIPKGDSIQVANFILKKYFRDTDEYTVTADRDVKGCDLYGQEMHLWTKSIEQIIWLCDINPDCAGFTFPSVHFKSSVANTVFSSGSFLYTKKKAHS